MRFLSTNLVTEVETLLTASSSNSNFPVSNLNNPLRSKRWRSSGTFIVDATNNKIDFKESGGGAELHATITSGTYTATTLATEIKTQLEVSGAETYTVSWSQTSGLWTIASAGAYLSILNNTGVNQAVSTLKVILGFPNTDKTGAVTYTGSEIAIHTSEYLTFDLITAQDISSVVLLWPKEDGITLTSDAVLTIQANATNTWASPAVSQALTVDNNYEVVSHFFTSAQSYRYWRLVIHDPKNTDLYIELGMIWLGENVSFNEPENGFVFGVTDNSSVSRTQFGHEYVDEYPSSISLEFSYSYLSYSVAQSLENAFRTNGTRKPVIVVFDETESVFDKDHFLIYGKMGQSFSLKHVNYDMFSGNLKITELG